MEITKDNEYTEKRPPNYVEGLDNEVNYFGIIDYTRGSFFVENGLGEIDKAPTMHETHSVLSNKNNEIPSLTIISSTCGSGDMPKELESIRVCLKTSFLAKVPV